MTIKTLTGGRRCRLQSVRAASWCGRGRGRGRWAWRGCSTVPVGDHPVYPEQLLW